MVRNLLVLLSTIFVVVNAFNNHNENHGGYPTWFSKSNHMLLSKFKDVVQPNVTVAKDGSGQFKTVTEAINSYPTKSRGRYVFVVYVKAGIYNEYITIAKNKNNILLYGDGPTKTIITGSKSLNNGASKTMDTATFCKLTLIMLIYSLLPCLYLV
jgi:pectinesterase